MEKGHRRGGPFVSCPWARWPADIGSGGRHRRNEGSLLTPRLRVFFSTKSNGYIKPELLDLGRKLGHGGGDRIVSAEVPEKWGVDPQRFLLVE